MRDLPIYALTAVLGSAGSTGAAEDLPDKVTFSERTAPIVFNNCTPSETFLEHSRNSRRERAPRCRDQTLEFTVN